MPDYGCLTGAFAHTRHTMIFCHKNEFSDGALALVSHMTFDFSGAQTRALGVFQGLVDGVLFVSRVVIFNTFSSG